MRGSLKLVSGVQTLQSNINCGGQNSESRLHEPGATRCGCARGSLPNSRGCCHTVVDVNTASGIELGPTRPSVHGQPWQALSTASKFSLSSFSASVIILLNIGFSKLTYGPSQASAPLSPPTFTEKTWAHINFLPPHPKMGLHVDPPFPAPPQLHGKQNLPVPTFMRSIKNHSRSSSDAFSGLDPSDK